jgi:hypothetical protein
MNLYEIEKRAWILAAVSMSNPRKGRKVECFSKKKIMEMMHNPDKIKEIVNTYQPPPESKWKRWKMKDFGEALINLTQDFDDEQQVSRLLREVLVNVKILEDLFRYAGGKGRRNNNDVRKKMEEKLMLYLSAEGMDGSLLQEVMGIIYEERRWKNAR